MRCPQCLLRLEAPQEGYVRCPHHGRFKVLFARAGTTPVARPDAQTARPAEVEAEVAVARGGNPFLSPQTDAPSGTRPGPSRSGYLTWSWICFGIGVVGYVLMFGSFAVLDGSRDPEMVATLIGTAALIWQLAAAATGMGLAAAAKPRGGRHSAATILPSVMNALLVVGYVLLAFVGLGMEA